MDLTTRFSQVSTAMGFEMNQVALEWKALRKAYGAKYRKYHNLNHLRELFGYYERYKANLIHGDEVAFAIFYHDFIYNIWHKTNEMRSAQLACNLLSRSNLDEEAIKRIYNLIMVTQHHTPMHNADEKWMIDFDLGILGKSWDVYQAYVNNIRKEYRAVPSFIYKKGRKKVLQHFLDKQSIYQTEAFYTSFETQAKDNLLKELKLL